jgi:hypothetical protein
MRSLVFLLPVLVCCSADDSSNGDAGSEAEAGPAPPYTQTLFDNARIGSDSSQSNFQNVTADVQLTGAPFANVNLVVDLTSACYPFSNWATDKPPAGQYWPADCDAFDRNFEMALLDPGNPTAPGLELVRAITPFGGPEHIEQDVTDVFNYIGSGDRTFKITIPSYSDSKGQVSGSNGGWNVSAHLDVTPGPAPNNVLLVQSLIYTSIPAPQNGLVSAQPFSLPFTLPPGTTSTTIEYRVTGHGGANDDTGECIGPADEFCQRTHTLSLDGQPLGKPLVPWRNDCNKLCTQVTNTAGYGPSGKYCQENPCGAIGSVDAPRANWCPGSETPPITFQPQLARGAHAFGFNISTIAGQWRVSATVYAYQ